MSIKVSSLVWQNGPDKSPDMLMLLAIADNADDDGTAWPSIETLARKCRVDRRTAQRTVRRLEVDGWLTTITGGGTRGGREVGIPNRYRIDVHRLSTAALTPPSSNSGVDDSQQRRSGAPKAASTPQEPSVEPPEEPSVDLPHPPVQLALVGAADVEQPTDVIAAEFDGFWRHWPDKRGRKTALTAYRRARKRATLDAIAAGVRTHVPVLQVKIDNGDRQFVPHAATWLNQDRWADPPPPMPRTADPYGAVDNPALLAQSSSYGDPYAGLTGTQPATATIGGHRP